jgi:hypothetical protein
LAELSNSEPRELLTWEDMRDREVQSLYTDPALAEDELAQAAATATGYTGQFQQYVVALHEKDIDRYLSYVWSARVAAWARDDIHLGPDESLAVFQAFRKNWLEYREWARGDYRTLLETSASREDVEAARREFATKIGTTYSALVQDVRGNLAQLPGGDALYARIQSRL